LPVVDRDERLVGIITEHDVLRLVAGRGLLAR
jgi:CBS domain-containing protein